jgi:AcrR family transcriptional regulator
MVCLQGKHRISKKENGAVGSTTKRRWLEEGFTLLEERGAEALTIETLSDRLGVTKGSFYHHFTNYQNFKESLLVFFEEERTLQIIQLAEQAALPRQKWERVIQATLKPSRLEVAIRAWSLQDLVVQDHQRRIDQQRIAYLEEVAYAQNGDRLHATQVARVFYSIYIGSQHIIPPIQGEELAQLYLSVQHVFEGASASASDT